MAKIKNKQYYISVYIAFCDACLKDAEQKSIELEEDFDLIAEANEHFEECAKAEHIAGYYLVFYADNYLNVWKENIKGLELSEQDREVTEILQYIEGGDGGKMLYTHCL